MVRPFGRRRLALVLSFMLLQGLLQMIGVTSIFPFLALASDPGAFANTQVGQWLHRLLPGLVGPRLLMAVGLLAIAMLTLSNLANLVGDYLRARYANGVGHALRMRLMERYAGQPYPFFLTHNSNILIKKVVQDTQFFVNSVLMPMLAVVSLACSAVFLTAALLIPEPGLTSITIAVVAGFYAVFFRVMRSRRSRISRRLKAATRGGMVHAQQLIGGIKPIMVQGRSGHFIRRYAGHSRQQARYTAQLPVLSNLPRCVVEPVAFGGLIALVLVYDSRGRDLSALLPTLGVMALAGYRLLPVVQRAFGQLTIMHAGWYALEEIEEGLTEADTGLPAVADPEPLTFGRAITLDALSFRYPGSERFVHQGLALTIPRGSSVALIGATGSGKSTLVDLLLGLQQPTAGSVRVDDTALDSPGRIRAWQDRVGYVPQEVFLLDDSLSRNIAFGLPDSDIDQDRVRAAASMAQIAGFVEGELPDGYDTRVGERGVRLSGGQRQRIALARALYDEPELLLLDEATSALDHETESRFLDVVHALSSRGLTLVMVTHRLDAAGRCDQQVRLDSEVSKQAEDLRRPDVLSVMGESK